MPAASTTPDIAALERRFRDSTSAGNKQQRVHACLRAHIQRHRTQANRPFHSMRELARCFGVSLRTIQVVFEKLEHEGLLLTISASKTLITGRRQKARVTVRGVVGLPLWLLGSRYFGQYKVFSRTLGDLLWEQHVVLDTIPFWEAEDRETGFADRLIRHKIDHVVWFQPFRHNRETILKLKDHGIRSLLISDAELSPLPPDIQIEWESAYRNLLHDWKHRQGICSLLIIVHPGKPSRRSHFFAHIAQTAGFTCEVLPMSPELSPSLAKRLKKSSPQGIVLLDEDITVDMVFSHPHAFLELCRRHRFFFGRGMLNLPFVLPPGLTIERAYAHTESIAEQSVRILSAWRQGNAQPGPIKSSARFISEYPLERHP